MDTRFGDYLKVPSLLSAASVKEKRPRRRFFCGDGLVGGAQVH